MNKEWKERKDQNKERKKSVSHIQERNVLPFFS